MNTALEQAYCQIEARFDRLDFSALFRGFHRFPFALYDDSHAFINGKTIDKPAGFLGNTSVKYNGEYTAIWKLEEGAQDWDVLASKLVHEMLHAFQNASGETRWADEREALAKYRYDETNFSVKLTEADCMRHCLTEHSSEDFERLLRLRRARRERFPYEYDYEARIEQIEGTANHIELAALKQLDETKAKQRWEALFTDLSDPSRYFPVRAVTYLSGAAMIACLREYTDMVTDSFIDVPFSVEAIANVQPCQLPENDASVTKCLSDWQDRSRKKVEQALKKGELVLNGEYRLIGWNVYDSVRCGKYAILSVFIGYIEGAALPQTDEELFAKMKVLNGDFVAKLDDSLRLYRVWRQ